MALGRIPGVRRGVGRARFVRAVRGTPLETSWSGVFTVSDAPEWVAKRVVSTVGAGTMAVQMMRRYLARTG
ncbi:hypothetical protein GCM10010402_78830 [Actinomadura luteofluorescens]